LADFKDEGRYWRRNTWWRMRLMSLCTWWILNRRSGSVRRRLWRMNMWCRTMLKSLFRWFILGVFGWVVEEGWDGVSPFFIVFGWESALSVRDEHQEKWDKSITEKITDDLIPLC
jgi:hypothetical protein